MSTMDEWIVRGTAWAAFACCMTAWMRASRMFWLAGSVVMIVHVVCAFQFAHHWSHAAAYEATAAQSAAVTGFRAGSGLWVNYAVLLVWLADAVWQCWSPSGHAARPSIYKWLLHGFLAFVWFNATVVFAHGMMRWAGLACWIVLAIWFWRSRIISAASLQSSAAPLPRKDR